MTTQTATMEPTVSDPSAIVSRETRGRELALRSRAAIHHKVTRGVRAVTPTMAFRVARFADAPIDALLAGQCVPVGTCPHCGRAPDFTDEETVISDRPTITTASSV